MWYFPRSCHQPKPQLLPEEYGLKSKDRKQKTNESFYHQGQKYWGNFCICGAFFSSHMPNPIPHPTNKVERVYPEFFRVSTLCRVEGGRTPRTFRKGCTVLWGHPQITENYEYCITVPSPAPLFCIAYGNSRFSSLLAAGDVSRGGTSATQRQKFHTDDANQCLHNKSGSHGVPNANLFNFTFLLVDFGKMLCSSANEL